MRSDCEELIPEELELESDLYYKSHPTPYCEEKVETLFRVEHRPHGGILCNLPGSLFIPL